MIVSTAIAEHEKGIAIHRGPEFKLWTCAYLLKGKIELKSSGKIYLISSPSFFIIPALLEYEFVVKLPDEHYWCIFSPEYHLSVLLRESADIQIFGLDFNREPHREIAKSMEQAFSWWSLSPPRIPLANNALERALLLSMEEMKSIQRCGSDHRISLALSYIAENIHQDLEVSKIAKAVNISPSHFASLFKKDMQCTPGRYVEGKRMELAAELLLDTDARVNEVAERVGYSNPFHFSRRFHANFGQSPRDFRRQPVRNRYEIVPKNPFEIR